MKGIPEWSVTSKSPSIIIIVIIILIFIDSYSQITSEQHLAILL